MGHRQRKIIIPYRPRPLQQEVHDNLKRWNVLVCHRRFGKTVCAINHLIKVALTCKLPNPRCGYLAPQRNQAKQIVWDYLQHYSRVIPGVTANQSELRCDMPNGGRVTLFGCDNPDALRGIYMDAVVLDEYAQMPPKVWGEIVRPTLSDRQGGAMFVGTPMGKNQFYTLLKDAQKDKEWYARMFKASETGIITDKELKSAAKAMTDEQYRQEYECSFDAAIMGAYYGTLIEQAERDGRICKVPYDNVLPVDTAWDIGVDDECVIWFIQGIPGGELHVINHLHGTGKGVDWYLDELAKLPYRYGTDYVPHDMEARSFVAGNRSPADVARRHGRNLRVIERMNPLERIQATRSMLPRVWFDKKRCEYGIEALKQYRKEYDDKKSTFKETPLHDWCSHSADAIGHFAVGYRGPITGQRDSWEILPAYEGEP